MDVLLVAVKCVCSSVYSNAEDFDADDLTACTTLRGKDETAFLSLRNSFTVRSLHQALSTLNEAICGVEMCVRRSNAIWHMLCLRMAIENS